jgi:hypothetical protein
VDVVKRSAAAALVVLALGCGGTTEPEVDVSPSFVSAPKEVVVDYGQEVRVGSSMLRVAFTGVEDSRCPMGMLCVWQGNAAVDLAVAAGSGPSYPLRLNTSLDPQQAEWQGLRFSLVEVRPAPRADTPTKKEDYSITLRIDAIE